MIFAVVVEDVVAFIVTILTDHRHHGHHQHYHHRHCHHRHHQVGMELDSEQEELWNSYTEENREKCFWLFLNSFVEKWEKQVIILISLIIFFSACSLLKSAKNSSKTRQSYIFARWWLTGDMNAKRNFHCWLQRKIVLSEFLLNSDAGSNFYKLSFKSSGNFQLHLVKNERAFEMQSFLRNILFKTWIWFDHLLQTSRLYLKCLNRSLFSFTVLTQMAQTKWGFCPNKDFLLWGQRKQLL